MTTAVLRIAEASVGQMQGSSDLVEALEQSSGPLPGKLVHLCLRSRVTVLSTAPGGTLAAPLNASHRHAREDGLAHSASARQLPALALNPFCELGELAMAYLVPSEFVTKMVDAGESKIFMSTRDAVIRARQDRAEARRRSHRRLIGD